MKWQCCFDFIVPPGLLLVFPELSLVRCGRPYTIALEAFEDQVKTFVAHGEVPDQNEAIGIEPLEYHWN